MPTGPLVIAATHPIQYQAPVFRRVRELGVPVHIVYGGDFSISGYYDREFKTSFSWDVDLVTKADNYTFLSKVCNNGATCSAEVSGRGLRSVFNLLRPAAILINGYRSRFHMTAIFEAMRQHYPVIIRAETTDHAFARGTLKDWCRDRILRYVYDHCDYLLPIGARSRDHYRRLGCKDEKLIFSPYCVDSSPFQCGEDSRHALRSATRQALQIKDSDIVVLFSGKLSRRKGPDLLVKALKELPTAKRQNVVLLFLGNGPERLSLEKELGVQPSIRAHFVGFKPQKELSAYYHGADLLALPSVKSETWGLVVNEALHHGVPCVVSDAVGCAPDLIEPGHTGEIAAAGSIQALRDAIERCFELSKSPQIRDFCRERVCSYSIDRAATGIADAYWRVLKTAA